MGQAAGTTTGTTTGTGGKTDWASLIAALAGLGATYANRPKDGKWVSVPQNDILTRLFQLGAGYAQNSPTRRFLGPMAYDMLKGLGMPTAGLGTTLDVPRVAGASTQFAFPPMGGAPVYGRGGSASAGGGGTGGSGALDAALAGWVGGTGGGFGSLAGHLGKPLSVYEFGSNVNPKVLEVLAQMGAAGTTTSGQLQPRSRAGAWTRTTGPLGPSGEYEMEEGNQYSLGGTWNEGMTRAAVGTLFGQLDPTFAMTIGTSDAGLKQYQVRIGGTTLTLTPLEYAKLRLAEQKLQNAGAGVWEKLKTYGPPGLLAIGEFVKGNYQPAASLMIDGVKSLFHYLTGRNDPTGNII